MEDTLSSAVWWSVCFSVSFTASCSETLQRKVDSEEKLHVIYHYVWDPMKNTCLVVPQWKKNWLLNLVRCKLKVVNVSVSPEASEWWYKEFITREMGQLLLFHCYFIITSLDARLNLLFFSLQLEEFLSKRISAIMFFVFLEDLPITCNFLLVGFPCWVTKSEQFSFVYYCPRKHITHICPQLIEPTCHGCSWLFCSPARPSVSAHTGEAGCCSPSC